MLSVDELKELCELCEQENIRFLSDEIYHGEYNIVPVEKLTFLNDRLLIFTNRFQRNHLRKARGDGTLIFIHRYCHQLILEVLFHAWMATWLDGSSAGSH
jgi:hypothetical protein